MEIQLLGAAREVGRSCIFVESDGLNLLLDCGVSTGAQNSLPDLANAKTPHAIALSHAHLDHSGFLPAVYKHANPPILCTFPTIPLVNMLLEDMQKLLNDRGVPALFSEMDMKRMNRSFLAMPYDSEYSFFNGTKVKFLDAGHILGSGQVFVSGKEGNLLYSGDINSVKTAMHNPAKIPKDEIDVLVMESTYGGRDHGDRKKLEKVFCNKIRGAIEGRGAVVIPSFAVGRTQEIIQILLENDLIGNVVMDGMGMRTTETYLEFPSYVRDSRKLKEAFTLADKAYDAMGRKRNSKAGKIIVATAGMLEGGPALSYISRLQIAGIPTYIYLTGFQAIGTNGRLLKEQRKIRIDGKTVDFTGVVEAFDFSAHSGRKELLSYVQKTDPKKIILVHGDLEEMGAMHATLKEQGRDVMMPELNKKIEI
ncbi:MAG: MBL fold metallo-hydrolase [Candidatus Micrarchaeota archaeon]